MIWGLLGTLTRFSQNTTVTGFASPPKSAEDAFLYRQSIKAAHSLRGLVQGCIRAGAAAVVKFICS